MKQARTFQRRGVVEGFFGAPWSMMQRRALFELGATRGMNTYLYAPKDDPYHRKYWRKPYPRRDWQALLQLIRRAQKSRIDFVYGFHPGEGLCFSEEQPIQILLEKAQRFYDVGIKTFAVLFDDIPSRLVQPRDRRSFNNSLAAAEALWLNRIITAQPATWTHVEWWICPSYYSEDALLERVFGRFEAQFLETLARYLPVRVACFWTGPAVVSEKISAAHARRIARTLKRPLLLWDNYPVNDLSMSDELHIGPLQGRDPRLPEYTYGYLNNPMLQPNLSLIPLATCFDYAAASGSYNAEKSWARIIIERFGAPALPHWRAIREFSNAQQRAKQRRAKFFATPRDPAPLRAALAYMKANRRQQWAREMSPWLDAMRKSIE
jgi:hyaluronoglucosaminidase